MSDIGSGTPQRDVDKIITEALKVWEKFGFKDIDLWETFQEDFEGFTEEDFRSASNHSARRLRNCLRKFGVWIRKQQRYTIARSLYEALLEEEPTEWTEAEIMACLDKEEFASYHISWLLEFDFRRKPRLSLFHPTYPSGPRPAATSSASSTLPGKAPVRISSASPTPVPVNTFTIPPSTTNSVPSPTRPTGTAPESFALSSASPTPTGEAPVRTFLALPTQAPIDASTILPLTTTYVPPLTPPTGTGPAPFASSSASSAPSAPAPDIGPTPTAYMHRSGTGPKLAVHTQPSSTGPAHAVQTPPSAINLPAAMTPTSTGHASLVDPPPVMTHTSTGHATPTRIGLGRDLSNSAKIHTDGDETKYSGRDDSFTYKLIWAPKALITVVG